MKIVVNGDAVVLGKGDGLVDLFEQLGVNPESVAVMVDGEIVARASRGDVRLSENCNVDILTLAAGG